VLGGSRLVACVWRTGGNQRGERRSTAVVLHPGTVETIAQRPKQRNSCTAPQRPFGISFAAQAAALGWKVRGRTKEGALTHLGAGRGRRDEFETEAGVRTRVGARAQRAANRRGWTFCRRQQVARVCFFEHGGVRPSEKRQTSFQGSAVRGAWRRLCDGVSKVWMWDVGSGEVQ
jgi:hypothetical protein